MIQSGFFCNWQDLSAGSSKFRNANSKLCVDDDVPITDIDACTWSKPNIDGYFYKFFKSF